MTTSNSTQPAATFPKLLVSPQRVSQNGFPTVMPPSKTLMSSSGTRSVSLTSHPQKTSPLCQQNQ